MPATNRVTPMGEIVAVDLRGSWTGNRGVLHDEQRRIVRHHTTPGWIVCALEFNGRVVEQWAPGQYTPLFFHDEAVALAAGHRPCGQCRHPAYAAFREAWTVGNEGPLPSAAEINRTLHAERLVAYTRERRLHELPWATLPEGAFVRLRTGPALVLADRLVPWDTSGYAAPTERPRTGTATVVTPPSSLGAIAGGYRPQIDRSAADS